VSVLAAASTAAHAIEPVSISADQPWFVFRAPGPETTDALVYADQLRAGWDKLDQRLKPFGRLELPGPRTGEVGWGDRFYDVLNELNVAEISTVVSVTDSPRTLYPLNELRSMFDQFTSVQAVHVSGLSFESYPRLASSENFAVPAQVRWLAGAIEIASEYGRRVLIELDGLEWVHLVANTWNEPLLDAMRSHASNVVPLNGPGGPHGVVGASTALGLWIEDAALAWGVTCDSAWYAGAHFVEPGIFGNTSAERMPPQLYRAMILNGAMTGATIYRFPAAQDLWTGPRSECWDTAIGPTLGALVRRGYIARKEFVLDKMHVALRLNPATTVAEFESNLADLDPIFHAGRMLHGAYGLEMPGQVPELILNNGTFYWIPVLSPFARTQVLQNFDEVLVPGALSDAREWRERLSTHYTPDGGGTAFIGRIGRATFVMQSRENFYEEQRFSLAAVPAPVRGAKATRDADGIEVSWPFREGDVFYRVYRRVFPETEWKQISEDIDVLSFKDLAVPTGGETVAYAVTALTNETEPYEGTVNYGDYLLVDTVESRVVEEIVLESDTQAATGLPVLPEVDGRPASQQWWPGLDDLEGDRLLAAQSIVAQIESFEYAYRTGSVEALLAHYHPDYADAAGWGGEYIRAAWDLFFRRYRPGPMHRQIRSWDFGWLATDERISVTLYCRLEAQAVEPDTATTPSPPLMFPDAPNGELTFTFQRAGDQWQIVSTEPALPHIDDWLPALGPR
jgi:hypothetical protein